MTDPLPHNHEAIRIQLTFPIEVVKQPVIFRLVSDFGLIPNIRRANMDVERGGFIFLEISGRKEQIGRALVWMQGLGIDIDAIGMDGIQEWAI